MDNSFEVKVNPFFEDSIYRSRNICFNCHETDKAEMLITKENTKDGDRYFCVRCSPGRSSRCGA